jgi:thioredoxin reductase
MGLIRNAVEQGKQAIDSIRKFKGIGRPTGDDCYDVVIVGAGPAGFSASLASMQHGIKYKTLEQDSLGGTVYSYPRGKVVMTAPADLPLHGKTKFRETTKESLLDFWSDVEKKTGVQIQYRTEVESIDKDGDMFMVRASGSAYRTRTVLLAIGRRGTPRKLDVPGEEQSKVVYRLIDPAQYRGQQVLVVGGGDSALEAAVSLSGEPQTTVTLSYRSGAFSRAKEKNQQAVQRAEKSGRLKVLLNSNVDRINGRDVRIRQGEQVHTFPNDAVVVSAGGILPTGFLKSIGIDIRTHHGD